MDNFAQFLNVCHSTVIVVFYEELLKRVKKFALFLLSIGLL